MLSTARSSRRMKNTDSVFIGAMTLKFRCPFTRFTPTDAWTRLSPKLLELRYILAPFFESQENLLCRERCVILFDWERTESACDAIPSTLSRSSTKNSSSACNLRASLEISEMATLEEKWRQNGTKFWNWRMRWWAWKSSASRILTRTTTERASSRTKDDRWWRSRSPKFTRRNRETRTNRMRPRIRIATTTSRN